MKMFHIECKSPGIDHTWVKHTQIGFDSAGAGLLAWLVFCPVTSSARANQDNADMKSE